MLKNLVSLMLVVSIVLNGSVETTIHVPEKLTSSSGKADETIISLVGDVAFVNPIERNSKAKGYDYAWKEVGQIFQQDDFTLLNLETSITKSEEKWPEKEFNFRSDPKHAEEMRRQSVEAVSLANNHTLDFGRKGFADTLRHLKKSGIQYTGGGADLSEAIRPILFEKNGTKIAVLSFSRVVPSVKWYAGKNRSGIVGAYDSQLEEAIRIVKEWDAKTDVLMVALHWGKMHIEQPGASEERAARRLIDAGADVVIGHHPHVLQGIELYKNRPIFYSLGNFIFPNLGGNADRTMIAQVVLEGSRVRELRLHPFRIEHGRPIPLEEKGIPAELKRWRKLSEKYGTEIDKAGTVHIKH